MLDQLRQVLNSAVSTRDHKCGDEIRLVLKTRWNGAYVIGLLPGHDARYYEFRTRPPLQYGIYRVDRAAFTEAMKGIGVETLPAGRPE